MCIRDRFNVVCVSFTQSLRSRALCVCMCIIYLFLACVCDLYYEDKMDLAEENESHIAAVSYTHLIHQLAKNFLQKLYSFNE